MSKRIQNAGTRCQGVGVSKVAQGNQCKKYCKNQGIYFKGHNIKYDLFHSIKVYITLICILSIQARAHIEITLEKGNFIVFNIKNDDDYMISKTSCTILLLRTDYLHPLKAIRRLSEYRNGNHKVVCGLSYVYCLNHCWGCFNFLTHIVLMSFLAHKEQA